MPKTKTNTIKSDVEKYDKKTPREHILLRPDTYVGDVEPTTEDMWIYSNDDNKIIKKNITYTPAFLKVFDELLVNARDAAVNDPTCESIKVEYNIDEGFISVYNNGDVGIPVEEHPVHKMLIPTMIFGELLTSSNYDDTEERTTGGKNGLGSKCISPDTKVLLYNGILKMAKDIKIGDKVIGDDGTPRNVLNTINGNGQMYEIYQTFGKSYKVNNEHMLTLYFPEHKKIHWNDYEKSWYVSWWQNNKINYKSINEDNIVETTTRKRKYLDPKEELENFCKTINDNNIIDISIKDFMKLDKVTQTRLHGIRGSCIMWDKKDVEIDPYTMGLWIGDNNEKQIVDDLNKWGKDNYSKILNNKLTKYISKDYIINDRDTRLQLLAGIIDGNKTEYCKIVLDSKYEMLTKDIIYLARSLGFYSDYSITSKGNEIIIIGDEIPSKIYNNETIFKDYKSTGMLKIKDIGNSDYIGIEIDGNQRFLINDFTVTHNCANIFSSKFIIEVDDAKRNKRFKQVWLDNMLQVMPAEVTKLPSKTKSSVKVTFYPDFSRFGITDLNNDHLYLFHRRAIDISAISNNKLKVFFNDTKIDATTLKQYIELSLPGSEIYYDTTDRWTVGVLYKPDQGGEVVSFVNGINTYRGGTHCNHVIDNIIKTLINDYIKKKDKDIKVTPALLKENLVFFINSVIVNPSFSSQTKDTLTTKLDKFGSKYEPTPAFLKKLAKCGVVEQVIELAKFKENSNLKKTDGKKQVKLNGIPKLEDANKAGTKESSKCTLILTEGDSAKATAMAGLSIIGRDYYGVFPLKGKILNVREAVASQLLANEEIKNLKLILGLKQGEDYSSDEKFSTLRYGHVLLLTDQDSVSGDTPLLLKNNDNLLEIKTIDDISTNWVMRDNKEVSTTEYKVWSDNGWTNIKEVIRHKVTKKMYRVLTHTGVVDVTEDHSLIDSNKNEITPSDCKIGDKLLHSFPNFETEYNYSEFNITEDEAYILGSFWVNGSYNILSKEIIEKYKNIFYDKDENKKIPTEILNSPKIIKETFYKGFSDSIKNNQSNYNLDNDNYDVFDIDSKIGAHGMYLLCKSIGYDISININPNKPKVYTLTATKGKLQSDPIAIKKIIDLGTTEQYVYDIETENHHFQAGIGSLIVHNTDGSHIKGLFINMLHTLWPSLVKRNNFVQSLNTPIVKATKGKEVITFYNLTDYESWKESSNTNNYKVKYYKGLGTSTSQEAREYFIDIETKLINYFWENIQQFSEEIDNENIDHDDAIKLAFDKTRADDRKKWLMAYDRNKILKYEQKVIPYYDFIHYELIHFSNEDLIRSIPSVIDGLKPSQRKILYGAFLRGLDKDEVKVAQLAGFVSDKAAYHHGEMSLNGAIIGMAQDFVGSNNINILKPSGQFGCLAPETLVLMWNGTVQTADSIKIGDQLVGDDGNVRNVLNITSGIDNMYEIVTEYGETYTVNSEHILTLGFKNNGTLKCNSKENNYSISYFDNNKIKTIKITYKGSHNNSKITKYQAYRQVKKILDNNKTNKIDIKISDYMELPVSIKKDLYMISNSNIINWDKREVKIDPYNFGYHIGNSNYMTNMIDNNEFLRYLNDIKLFIIPNEYLYNDAETRLQVLAGIIDTCGHVKYINNNQTIYINLNKELHEYLINDLHFLCNSLGYVTLTESNDNTIIFNIMGNDLYKIPTNIVKNIVYTEKSVENYYSSFKIKHLGKGPFNGWSLDGNERFLLGNFIITHNSRLKGGKDAASPRYIWTMLEDLTSTIFNPNDTPVLNQQNDDGMPIEPEYYAPIIPMVLINGAEGIGTGFSTKIPPYNPGEVINNIRNMINGKKFKNMDPWWQGFEGIVSKNDDFNYEIYGTWTQNDNKLTVTELPVGEWTYNYKEFLEKMLEDTPLRGKADDKKVKKQVKKDNPFIGYKDNNSDKKVHFELTFEDGYLDDVKDIDKQFHLYKKYSVSNMHLYGPEGHIKRYETVEEIMKDYYNVRLDIYQKRKDYELAILEHLLKIISNKVRFILMVVEKKLKINNKKKDDIENELEENKFPKLGRNKDDTKISYDYLLTMPIYNLTFEKIEELKKQHDEKESEYNELNDKTIQDIWLEELDTLEDKYNKWCKKKTDENKSNTIKKKKSKK